ncbi:MAG: BtaA family protein [Planctomycetaceae bacterium]|nr:BtaA family protein [Planctomycetaceae bacterium]
MRISDWLNGRMFNMVHGNNLVYNTCWEDPRLDRVALDLGPDDRVVVITSAGCNALDYALESPRHVHAVDMNPRQNALLELKMAGIRHLEYEDFFDMFGRGRMTDAVDTYHQVLRSSISPWSQQYWDRWIRFFDNRHRPFYYRGTSGTFAKVMNVYVDRVLRVREWLDAILDAASVDEQRQIYDEHLRERFWTRSLKFAMGRNATLSMVGVPKAQRQQVDDDYDGGIVKFVQDCVEAVFARLPLADNYFWRVYLTGEYTQNCCPEYLKPENFQRLKDGLIDRVSTHTNTVEGFLDSASEPISRFVLLDHMDWLSNHHFHLLESEWSAILRKATPDARFLWRSGGLQTEFVNQASVSYHGQQRELGELLSYDRALAENLHDQDRVHTYGSFHIAGLAA